MHVPAERTDCARPGMPGMHPTKHSGRTDCARPGMPGKYSLMHTPAERVDCIRSGMPVMYSGRADCIQSGMQECIPQSIPAGRAAPVQVYRYKT